MFDIDRQPVNKTAALVTSQSGCASDGTLSDEQMRENLVSQIKSIDSKIVLLKKGSKERKLLGKEKARIALVINKIRPSRKCKNLNDYIIEVLREELTPFQFKSIINKASILADKDRLAKEVK